MRTPTLLALASLLLASCGSAPKMELDLRSDPQGAQVFLSRRGERSYQAKVGPVKGGVKAEALEEEFLLLGTTPLEFTTPLEETESDASVLGFGGRVVLKYKEGVLRFEKPGFGVVERHVRFHDGEAKIEVEFLDAEDDGGQDGASE